MRNLKSNKKRIKTKLISIAAGILIPYAVLAAFLSFAFLFGGSSLPEDTLFAMALDIPHEYLSKAYDRAAQNYMNFAFLLTISAVEAGFDTEGFDDDVLERAMERAMGKDVLELDASERGIYDIFLSYYNDLGTGPLALGLETRRKREVLVPVPGEMNEDGTPVTKVDTIIETSTKYYSYSSYNDFGDDRTYGGDREHEGNDLIAESGTPIVSMTDGIITSLGWNEFGGNIVGITTNRDTYFYYAHMSRHAENLSLGDSAYAGMVIGYVGDTGYGPPGTSGKFAPHLHLQIGVKVENREDYLWIAPYNIVKFMDQFRVMLRKEG